MARALTKLEQCVRSTIADAILWHADHEGAPSRPDLEAMANDELVAVVDAYDFFVPHSYNLRFARKLLAPARDAAWPKAARRKHIGECLEELENIPGEVALLVNATYSVLSRAGRSLHGMRLA